jgi:hypothetical protein
MAFPGKLTLPRSTLKETLCEGDTGRNLPTMHLLDSDILILIDILLIAFIPPNLCMSSEE